MSARNIEGRIGAWLPDWAGMTVRDLFTMEPESVFKQLSYSSLDMSGSGWVRVGAAQVTVEIAEIGGLVGSQIDVLKEARQKVLADAQMQATEFDRQIQSLLAIEHDTGAAA